MKKLSVLSLSLILAACGGGGGGSGTTAADTTMVVTPSLGKFSLGTAVKLKKPDGTPISSGTIGSNGSATLTVGSYSGPIVIEVLGAAASGSTAKVTYYDERDGSTQDFGAGKVLRAAVPALQGEVGVTALTNAAVAQLQATNTTDNLVGIDAAKIFVANSNVATRFGVPDILVAPRAVGLKSDLSAPAKDLIFANPGDYYAVVLAALAKTATAGKTAADVSDSLALDLTDGLLDGQQKPFGTPLAAAVTAPAYVHGTIATTLATNFATAAAELMPANEVAVSAALAPVMNPAAPTATVTVQANQSAITLAKAMFAELRTTLKSFANGNKTGFLDTQAQRINDDIAANVAPGMQKVAGRVSALKYAVKSFEDAQTSLNTGATPFMVGTKPDGVTAAQVRINGSLDNVWAGTGSFNKCWTDSPTVLSATLTCTFASSDNAVKTTSTTGYIKLMTIAITRSASGTGFDYTATRQNIAVTDVASGVVTLDAISTPSVPTGNGTISATSTASLAINGTLPPSTDTTGIDTLVVDVTRTALTGANFRYTLKGSVATSNAADIAALAAAPKTVTLLFDTGSYFDQDESNIANQNTTAIKLVGTVTTNATKFTGTLEMGSFARDANGHNSQATSLTFVGAMRDTSTGGAGQIMTGNLAAAITGYSSYNPLAEQTGNNYRHNTLVFIGAIKAPERPLMTLILGVTKTGANTSSVSVSYSYGTKAITGSGTSDDANSANNSMTLSNQDGIQLVTKTGIASKSGTTVATLLNGNINYADGVTESLQ